jgi:hypothetical protein
MMRSIPASPSNIDSSTLGLQEDDSRGYSASPAPRAIAMVRLNNGDVSEEYSTIWNIGFMGCVVSMLVWFYLGSDCNDRP